MIVKRNMLLGLVVALLPWSTIGLENGLARTPPMGWMTWQRFRCITDCDSFPDDCIRLVLIANKIDDKLCLIQRAI